MVAVTSCEYALYDKTSPVPKWAGFVMNPQNLLYCKPKHRTKRLVLLLPKKVIFHERSSAGFVYGVKSMQHNALKERRKRKCRDIK